MSQDLNAQLTPAQTIGTAQGNYTLGNGYTCACGAWVGYGTSHLCNQVQQYVWPYQAWSYPVADITVFRGAVTTLKDLPAKAAQGEAFYVEKDNVLVVRRPQGWFHFDRK